MFIHFEWIKAKCISFFYWFLIGLQRVFKVDRENISACWDVLPRVSEVAKNVISVWLSSFFTCQRDETQCANGRRLQTGFR